MELKRRFDPKWVFITLYFIVFLVYIIIGLQPAEAARYEVSGILSIPSIGLRSDVTSLKLNATGGLDTPDSIVGSYGTINRTLLIGHSTTVFQNLNQLNLNEDIYYSQRHYRIISKSYLPKFEIDMSKIMAREAKDTIVIMTCAGELLENNDSAHRLILTAVLE